MRAITELGDELIEAILAPRRDDDACARGDEAARDFGAEARARAGDEDSLSHAGTL